MQGAAEVVPVSSSAHLALLPGLLGWDQPPGRTTLASALHAGSCAGILWALRRDLRRLPVRQLGLVAATPVPAALAGALAADAVELRLGRPRSTAGLLAAAGLLLAAADRRPQVRGVGGREAALAALAQVAALAPGVSRSGAATTALRGARVRRADAARFSLLMSLPLTAGAALLTLSRADAALLRGLALWLLPGVPAAAASAAWCVSRAPGGPLLPVALYRVAFAAAVVVRSREGRG